MNDCGMFVIECHHEGKRELAPPRLRSPLIGLGPISSTLPADSYLTTDSTIQHYTKYLVRGAVFESRLGPLHVMPAMRNRRDDMLRSPRKREVGAMNDTENIMKG